MTEIISERERMWRDLGQQEEWWVIYQRSGTGGGGGGGKQGSFPAPLYGASKQRVIPTPTLIKSFFCNMVISTRGKKNKSHQNPILYKYTQKYNHIYN